MSLESDKHPWTDASSVVRPRQTIPPCWQQIGGTPGVVEGRQLAPPAQGAQSYVLD